MDTAHTPSSSARRMRRAGGLLVLALALGGAALANLFTLRDDAGATAAAMLPDVPAGGPLRALDGTDARIIWTDRAGGVWVVQNLAWREGPVLSGSGAWERPRLRTARPERQP